MLSNYPYIEIPAFTRNTIDNIKHLLCKNGKQKTYEHVRAVANVNIKIAKHYGLDVEICELCGYLHDISAVIKPDDMMLYAQSNGWYIDESENKYPFILHQRISRVIAEQDFNITDERVLSAIECHSTLKENPSAYDMALFVADKLAWDQDGEAPFYDVVKTALETSLEAASLAYMQFIIDNKMILYPHKWFEDGMRYLKNRNRAWHE